MAAIEGSTVLVTGGQRGLGKAFVAELLARGAAKVYATARVPVPTEDPRVVALPLEVTDDASVAALAKAAADVSIVINNAGIVGGGELTSVGIDEAQAVFDANVFGPLRIAQAFAPVLAANGGGALVNIHSAVSWLPGFGVYGASKAAFWSLTNSLRLELASDGVQVVGVHLGYTDTDMIAGLDVPKNDPRQVAADTLDGIVAGDVEILADDASRQAKAALVGVPADPRAA